MLKIVFSHYELKPTGVGIWTTVIQKHPKILQKITGIFYGPCLLLLPLFWAPTVQQGSDHQWMDFGSVKSNDVICCILEICCFSTSRHRSLNSAVSFSLPDYSLCRQWGLKCRDLLLQRLGLRDSTGFYWGGPEGGRLWKIKRRRQMTKAGDRKESCASLRLALWQPLSGVSLLDVTHRKG